MLRSSFCDYSDAYVFVKGTISIAQVLAPAQPENVGKNVAFKNFTLFTDCISEISNTQIDNAKCVHVIMYNLIEYSNNYIKKEAYGITVEMNQL